MLPRITIVGRPNVGKSSLFNAMTGHKIAIVSDIENTTRDIIEYHIDDHENKIPFLLFIFQKFRNNTKICNNFRFF